MNQQKQDTFLYVEMHIDELPTVHQAYRPEEVRDHFRKMLDEVIYGPNIPQTD